MENNDIQFSFESFFIRESRIKRDISKSRGNINILITPSAEINYERNTFELNLKVDLKDDVESFVAFIDAMGIFKFINGIDKKILNNYFYTNAPAIIFPYIRAYISTLTGLHGFHQVVLPLMNLTYIKDEMKKNTIDIR
jgi:preprotein translocase subunit SecB